MSLPGGADAPQASESRESRGNNKIKALQRACEETSCCRRLARLLRLHLQMSMAVAASAVLYAEAADFTATADLR